MSMSPVRRVRSERALVVAAASLGAVAIAVVLTQTAQVVGRDAVRPVGPTPHPGAVAHARHTRPGPVAQQQPLYVSGPKLPPPAPGSKLPQYDQYSYGGFPIAAAQPVNDRPAVAPPAQSVFHPPAPAAANEPKATAPPKAAHSSVVIATPLPESDYTPPALAPAIQAPAVAATVAPAPTAPPTPSPTPPDRPLGGVEDARVLGRAVEPVMSDSARSQLSGPVSAVVVVTLTASGTVAGARIERSSGISSLDYAAIAAAKATSYAPARVDGRPIGGTYRALYEFTP